MAKSQARMPAKKYAGSFVVSFRIQPKVVEDAVRRIGDRGFSIHEFARDVFERHVHRHPKPLKRLA